MPKYCTTCMIQGQDESQCYVLHPELYPDKKENKKEEGKESEEKADEREPVGKEHKGTQGKVEDRR